MRSDFAAELGFEDAIHSDHAAACARGCEDLMEAGVVMVTGRYAIVLT